MLRFVAQNIAVLIFLETLGLLLSFGVATASFLGAFVVLIMDSDGVTGVLPTKSTDCAGL